MTPISTSLFYEQVADAIRAHVLQLMQTDGTHRIHVTYQIDLHTRGPVFASSSVHGLVPDLADAPKGAAL